MFTHTPDISPRTPRPGRRIAGWLSLAGTTLLWSSTVAAHGAPEFPISREYACYKNPAQPACQAAILAGGAQAIYDWNGVNQGAAHGNHQTVVSDGNLCAGGQEKFKGFDLARSDWPVTAWSAGADGLYEFRYHATAPHRTLEWRFYLSRDGWNPSGAPLAWSDLDMVDVLYPEDIITTADKRYVMRLDLPVRHGRHVLYSVWQRSDSGEAFYACSDVDFGGGGGTLPNEPTPLTQLGQVSAIQDLPAGAQAKLRVFGPQGEDLETLALTLSMPRGRADWLADLAVRVNSQSSLVRMGSLQGSTVVVPLGASVMQVYQLRADRPVSFELDTVLPSTPPTTPGAEGDWQEGHAYTVGQLVSYQGRTYRCLQAHTAYVGAGWNPAASPTLWQSVATTPPATDAWLEGASYVAGQVVSYQDHHYRCLQSHTAYVGAGWYPDVAGTPLWTPLD